MSRRQPCRGCAKTPGGICPACEKRAEEIAEDRYERTGRRWFR